MLLTQSDQLGRRETVRGHKRAASVVGDVFQIEARDECSKDEANCLAVDFLHVWREPVGECLLHCLYERLFDVLHSAC